MERTRKFLWGAVAVAFVVGVSACGEDEEPMVVEPEDDPPTISLSSPNGGETLLPGEDLDITWTATDDNQVVGVDLSYTTAGGEMTIATGVSGSSYTWTVPSSNVFGVRVKAVATDDADQTAMDESDNIFAIVAHSGRGYVTSAVCQTCHSQKYDDLFDSGHPYKLNKVVSSQPPTYPHSEVPTPPEGFTWDDITYVIGGYAWKARFMDADGYILVTGLENVPTQHQLIQPGLFADTAWTAYHPDDDVPKPYTCGACHTTGWQTTADNGGVNQDGLVGIAGTWEETGIRCEECHGPGVDHVATQNAAQITKDDTAELCGNCHFRDTNHNVLASKGFIRHHEQYDELINGGKDNFACTDCHEPHIGVRYDNAAAGGITVTCESCHATQAANNAHLVPVDCIDCHMGRASKSARAVHDYQGDVRTHIFTINTDPVGKSEMFFLDAPSGNTHTRNFITLDIACYSCHTDDGTPGVGGGGEVKTLAELSAKAIGIHN